MSILTKVAYPMRHIAPRHGSLHTLTYWIELNWIEQMNDAHNTQYDADSRMILHHINTHSGGKAHQKANTHHRLHTRPMTTPNGLIQVTHKKMPSRPSAQTRSNNSYNDYNDNNESDYDGRCYNCYETNHVFKSCKYDSPVECFTCHRIGHKSKHHGN